MATTFRAGDLARFWKTQLSVVTSVLGTRLG
jgi:hypothetical protein